MEEEERLGRAHECAEVDMEEGRVGESTCMWRGRYGGGAGGEGGQRRANVGLINSDE